MANDRKFLLPGEFAVTRAQCEIATLLGSCVAVTLWHQEKGFAAMNHFLLPESPDGNEEKGRYGDTSTNLIISLMKKFDPELKKLKAGIYGGGAVVGHLGSVSNIGDNNIKMAKRVLMENGVKISNDETGGENGRRIYMDTSTGDVSVRIIEKTMETKAMEKKHKDFSSRKIRVLIVDDSPLVRSILRKVIDSSPDTEVCGEAGDAFEARNMILELDPDVISLDIIMPKMSGLDFLKKLSQHYPKPVVICSTIAKAGSDIAQRGRRYGAVCCVDKDRLNIYQGLELLQKEYLPRIRMASKMVVQKKMFEAP